MTTWVFCLTAKWGCEALSAWHQIRGPHGLHGPITYDGAKCPGFIFRFEGRVFRLKGTLFEPTNRRRSQSIAPFVFSRALNPSWTMKVSAFWSRVEA